MQLLILGNGFDLQCNLPSSFGKYMASYINSIHVEDTYYPFYEKTYLLFSFMADNNSILNNLTFIELMVTIKYWKKEILWSDFERLLYDILYQEKSDDGGFMSSLWEKSFQYMINNQEQIYTNRLKEITIKDDYQLIGTMYFYRRIIGNPNPTKTDISINDWFDFLKTELNTFETTFRDYLKQNHSGNDSYLNSALTLLNKLTNNYNQLGKYKIMNFNYTTLPEPHQSNTENVHGLYSHKDSIIGIDGSSIPYKLEGYKFTKTFRRVDLLTRYNRIQKSDLLNYEYSEIAFYGHSLNEQDYSYFQSLFDGLNIYDRKIKLKFYYSFYEGKTHEEIYNDQIQSIIKLLETYGSTFDNKYKGKNLLSKIIIEQRLHIINI